MRMLDPAVVWAALEGHEDIITPAVAEREAYVKNMRCPFCQGDKVSAEIDTQRPFSENSLLPRFNCRCGDCLCLFTPHTFLVVEPAKNRE